MNANWTIVDKEGTYLGHYSEADAFRAAAFLNKHGSPGYGKYQPVPLGTPQKKVA